MNHAALKWLLFVGSLLCLSMQGEARNARYNARGESPTLSAASAPYCYTEHDIGKFILSMSNFGEWGDLSAKDCVTGLGFKAADEYPAGSHRRFFDYVDTWIGGIVDGDTLVSCAWEQDGPPSFGGAYEFTPLTRFTGRSSLEGDPSAVSEQDRICSFTDTALSHATDPVSHLPYEPLHIEVRQESYAWSYGYAEDILFFNFHIRNIGKRPIAGVYLGIYLMARVGYNGGRWADDEWGWLADYPSERGCGFVDTLGLAWLADNDGDPIYGVYHDKPIYIPEDRQFEASARSVLGLRFLDNQDYATTRSFNWWIGMWGIQLRSHVRQLGFGSYGRPYGNHAEYFVMANGEIDPDQPRAYQVLSHPNSKWATNFTANDIVVIPEGSNGSCLTSVGPYDLQPGSEVPVALAIIGGENFHTDPTNLSNLPYDPDRYLANLNFSDLAKNAVWAQKIYDNPGVDTDDDGYAGKFRVCNYESTLVDSQWQYTKADTEWYRGDGVPDWRAAGPPPPPTVWLTPIHNGIKVRFNGEVTETAKDVLTQKVDFEGYRIYVARDDRASSYSLLASYDREDYDKLVFNPNLATGPAYELRGNPLTIQQLRCLYGSGPDPCGDSSFDPLSYTRQRPFILPGYPDSVFIFAKHEFNASQFGVTTPIRKIYPDYPNPHEIPPDSITPDMYTNDGYFKYYEYEYTITGLLPSVPYWVNVTAFDFGSPGQGLSPLESSKTLHAQSAFPLHDLDAQVSGSDKIYVYPNPYRIDANYRLSGYEGRTEQNRSDDRVRAIWFANLPPKCTITIFTLDGDRVRTIEHNYPPGDPMASHDHWDLINRNMQRVVSGLYYWTVETPDERTQIGKLVIIR